MTADDGIVDADAATAIDDVVAALDLQQVSSAVGDVS